MIDVSCGGWKAPLGAKEPPGRRVETERSIGKGETELLEPDHGSVSDLVEQLKPGDLPLAVHREHTVLRAILECLGLPADAPLVHPARAPPELFSS
jgi:hypothetical protein